MSRGPAIQRIAASIAKVGEAMHVRRALPTRQRRLVGPWCFLDHFGPADVTQGKGMRVGPHPHLGLQTVTWLIAGEVLHRDSLGTVQTIVPGELNVMTSGRGISHSEESPVPRPAQMHGIQFWIALPDSARFGPPAFEHHATLPVLREKSAVITVLAGEHGGEASPATVHSPLVGLDLALTHGELRLPLRPDFEHALLAADGSATVDGEPLSLGELLYLGTGRADLALRCESTARLILVGGTPFGESVKMWWNFVARTKDELSAACRQWNAETSQFGAVHGYDGARLVAPIPPWDANGDAVP